MHDELQVRIDALRKEMEVGQQRAQDLERQLSHLRDTMLRISGAIQVLEELQAQAAPPAATPDKADGENKAGVGDAEQ